MLSNIKLHISSLIVTCALSLIYEAFSVYATNGKNVILSADYRAFGDYPVNLILALIAYLLCAFILKYTKIGTYTYAIGSNEVVAKNKKAQEYLDSYGFNYIDATKVIDDYNFEDRKLVEIVKSTYFNPKVLVVDETTTALGQKGREELFKVMHKVRDTGNCVIFISHDLEEVIEQSDNISVLRDGVKIGSITKEEATPDRLKAIGAGETAARYAGIRVERTKILIFVAAGCITGLAAFVNAIKVGSVTSTAGNQLETQIMIALVLGGMPVNGGAKVRFYNIILGVMTYKVLSSGLVMLMMPTQLQQLILGVIFLIEVAIFSDRKTGMIVK